MKNHQVVLASAIRTLKIRNVKTITAEYLRPMWDYRAEGLNLPKAQKALQAEIDRQDAVRATRRNNTGDVLRNNEGKYAKALAEKTRMLGEHANKWWAIYSEKRRIEDIPPHLRDDDKYDSAVTQSFSYSTPHVDLNSVDSRTSGLYPYCRPQFALADGIIGQVDFSVYDDWGYYSKRYDHPKTIVFGRGVWFVYPQARFTREADGTIKVQAKRSWQPLERFAGNWFFNVLAAEFGKKRVEKNLRKVQLHECFTLRLERKIAGIEIYSRIVGNTVYDVCALAGKETFHAETAKEAISGLREKRKSKVRFDSETLRAVFKNGKCAVAGATFCSTGVRNFCADNGIEENAEMSRADLRNIVLKNRTLNCEKYAVELRKIGISLNCK